MTYQVLARKYRPQSFQDVVGQDAVVQTIERALSTGRIAHAFLFTGSRGVGKTTLARILARCLTCEKGPTSRPCGTCALCSSITAGQAVDVIEIDGASNTGVEQVRELQEMARFLPQLSRFKIFIIDEVHMLSTSAFNALLKTLEEPPPHLKFVFATTEPHKIPVTVLSRCQRYDFRRISSSLIVARLLSVLGAEGVRIDQDGLEIIARAAEGGMRDALSLTDQVLSFVGAGSDGATASITGAQVTEALGLIDRRTIAALVGAVLSGDARACLTVVEAVFLRGFDLKQLVTLLAEELRHLSVAQATGTIRGFADLADSDIDRIDEASRGVDARDVLRVLGMALDGVDVVGRTEDARLALELVLLRMCRRAPIGDALLISEALVRLDRLARGQPVPPLIAREPPTSTTPLGIASQAFVIAGPGAALRTPQTEGTGSLARTSPVSSPHSVAPSTASSSSSSSSSAFLSSAPPVLDDVARQVGSLAIARSDDGPRSEAELAPSGPDAQDEPAVVVVNPPLSPRAKGPNGHASDESEPGADEDADAQVGEPFAPASPVTAAVAATGGVEDEEEEVDPLASLPLTGVDERWRAFVARLQRQRAGVFRTARVKNLADDHIELTMTSEWGVDEITRSATDPMVIAALEQAFGRRPRLVAIRAETGGVSIQEAEEALRASLQARLEEHAKAHPVVQRAVSLFGGEVRAVRRHGP